jgi:hypothetical protein
MQSITIEHKMYRINSNDIIQANHGQCNDRNQAHVLCAYVKVHYGITVLVILIRIIQLSS